MFETVETLHVEKFALRRIRTVPETVNMTFDFVRAHFGLISRSLVLIAFPPVLIALLLFYKYFIDLIALINSAGGMGGYQNSYIASFILTSLAGGILMLAASTLLIAIAHVIVHLYMMGGDDGLDSVTVQDVWKGVKPEFWRLLGTNVVLGVIYIITALLSSLIPFVGSFGIYVLLVFGAFYFPIRIYERRGIIRSFTLSADLVQGKWWATLGLYMLHYTMTLALSSLLILPVIVAAILEGVGVISIEELIDTSPWIVHVGGATMTLYVGLLVLLSCIPLFSLIFHYFSQRERKSGIGLLADLEKIGSEWVDTEAKPDDRSGREESFWNDRLRDA